MANEVYNVDGDRLADDEQIAGAIEKGRVAFKPGTVVNMIKPDGTTVGIPSDNAFAAMDQGYRIEGAAEEARRKYQAETRTSYAEPALAAIEGAVEAVPFGTAVSVAAQEAAGNIGYGKRAAQRAEVFPTAHGAGFVGGLAVGALAGGGEARLAGGGVELAAAAEAAEAATLASRLGSLARGTLATYTAPTRAVTALGGAAERAAGRLIGTEAKSLAGQVVQRAVALGARGAAEGSVYGASSAASEAALGDKELTAEALWAAAGNGALLGGLIGGAAGGAGPVVLRGAQKAAPVLRQWGETQSLRGLTGAAGADVARLEKSFGPERAGRIVRTLEEMEGAQAVGVTDWLPKVLRKAEAEQKEIGARLGATRKAMDAIENAKPLARATAARIVTKTDELIGSLRSGLNKDTIKYAEKLEARLEPIRDRLVKDEAISFADMYELQVGLGKATKFKGRLANPIAAELEKFRGIIKGEVDTAMEAASPQLGEKATEAYRRDNMRYADLAEALKIARNRVGVKGGSNVLGLPDYQAAAAGAAALGPAGLAGAAVTRALRTSQVTRLAGQAARGLADRVEQIGNLGRTADRVALNIASASKSALQGPYRARVTAPRRSAEGVRRFGIDAEQLRSVPTRVLLEYQQRSKATDAWKANPIAQAEATVRRVQNLTGLAPRTAQAMTRTAVTAGTFLASKTPQPSVPSMAGAPLAISDADRQKFLRYAKIVADPLAVLDEVKAGRVSAEAVEVVQKVYPRLYERMRVEMTGAMADLQARGVTVPYQQRLQVSKLFGVAVDPTERPAFVAGMQAMHGAAQAQENQAAAQPLRPARRQSKIASRRMTRAERLEAGAE